MKMSGKKNFLSVIAIMLVCIIVSVSAVGCGPDDGSTEKIDETKTQLYVASYNGGAGNVWISNMKKAFEEACKDETFEEGKKGVQVILSPYLKDEITGYTLYSKMSTYNYDVYFTTTPREEIVNGNMIISLDDFIDEPIGFGETTTIREKMLPYYLEQGYWAQDGKIYYIPTTQTHFGLSCYDVDLFEEKQFFISAESTENNLKWTGTGEKSVGADGIAGTYDDGLPVTESEYKALLQRIKSRGVKPYTWAGQYPNYMNAFVFNLDYSYDNGARARAYKSLTGSVYNTAGEKVDINAKNGYLTADSKGALEALELTEELVNRNNGYYSQNAFKTTQNQIKAQNEFLLSAKTNERIAMIIEGSWWENEALAMFEQMAKGPDNEKYAYKTRRFGAMLSPRLDASVVEDKTVKTILTSNSTAFIPVYSSKQELAKKFLKYFCTDKALRAYNVTTGIGLAYDYDLTDDEYDSLSYYAQNIYDIFKSDKILKNKEDRISDVFKNRQGKHYPYFYSSNCVGGGKEEVSCPFNTFYSYANMTAEKYFGGMKEIYSLLWSDLMKNSI